MRSSQRLTAEQAALVSDYGIQLFAMEGEYAREQARMRERPVDEAMLLATADFNPDGTTVFRSVSLPAEMLVMVLRPLRPRELEAVVSVNRAWQAAVRAIARERSQALGESDLSLKKLEAIDTQMELAPALITRLSEEDFDKLLHFEEYVIGHFLSLLEPHVLRDRATELEQEVEERAQNAWMLLNNVPKDVARQWTIDHADQIIAEVAAVNEKQAWALMLMCEDSGDLLPHFRHRLGEVVSPVLSGQDELATGYLLGILYLLPAALLSSVPDLSTLLAPLIDAHDSEADMYVRNKVGHVDNVTKGQVLRTLLRRIPPAEHP